MTCSPTTRACLDLSTAHVPGPNPDWGTLRAVSHEYGWVLFCDGEALFLREDGIPVWLRPIAVAAREARCLVVVFDQDAPECDAFNTYEW